MLFSSFLPLGVTYLHFRIPFFLLTFSYNCIQNFQMFLQGDKKIDDFIAFNV